MTISVNDPLGGSDSEQLTITVMDAEPPPEPDIIALPPVMDFGTVSVGELVDRAFLIYSNGNALLTISQIVSTDPQFAVLAYSQADNTFVSVVYSEADDQFVIEACKSRIVRGAANDEHALVIEADLGRPMNVASISNCETA